jgi:pepF/M3 family oligoendopeptidase
MSQHNLGHLPHWDVSTVYPTLESDELKCAIQDCEKRIKALEKFLNQHAIRKTDKPPRGIAVTREALAGYLARFSALIEQYQTISTYIRTFVATDSFNATARRMMSEVEPMGVRINQIDTRFSGWVGSLGKQLDVVLKKAERTDIVYKHAFFLREVAAQAKYLMSEAEESLAAELSLSGANAWSKLQGTLVSQLSVEFEREGRREKMSMPALLNIQHHNPDPEVRRSAYELEMATWEAAKEPLAAAMNGVKGTANTLNTRRGRKDPLHGALDAARMDKKTLDAMLGAMHDAFPIFRKYLKAKAKKLRHSGALPWWDVMAPTGSNERSYGWDEARGLILSHFGQFSPRLQALAGRAFEANWIDAEQRPGKRAGAFCTRLPAAKESRILCNFDGSLDQVSTIAHELGHAFHNECLFTQAPLNRSTPMTLAETASIFCETIIVDAALQAATSDAERLSILETDLIGKTQVIVDITSRYLFETEVFARRAKAELSADELCEIMLRCQRETYGDGLDERYLHKFMWTWKPHYYYAGLSFYNFPYAFGLLFGMGLYAIYQQRGPSFVPEYEALLAGTGMADAATLAKRFGINLRDKAFWKGSLDLIGERVEQYVGL